MIVHLSNVLKIFLNERNIKGLTDQKSNVINPKTGVNEFYLHSNI